MSKYIGDSFEWSIDRFFTMEDNQSLELSASHSSGTPSLNTSVKTLDVSGRPCFDPKGGPNTLSIRWKRWKRAFNLYMVSKGVTYYE